MRGIRRKVVVVKSLSDWNEDILQDSIDDKMGGRRDVWIQDVRIQDATVLDAGGNRLAVATAYYT